MLLAEALLEVYCKANQELICTTSGKTLECTATYKRFIVLRICWYNAAYPS